MIRYRNFYTLFILCAAIWLGGSANALAGSSPNENDEGLSGFYIAPLMVGTHDDSERSTDAGIGGDIRLGKKLTQHVSLELSAFEDIFGRQSGAGYQWDNFGVGLHTLFYFAHTRIASPFIDLGASYERSRRKLDPAGAGYVYSSDPVFNADLGVDLRLNDYGLALRLGAGYRWTIYNNPSRPPALTSANRGRFIFAEPQAFLGVVIPLSPAHDTAMETAASEAQQESGRRRHGSNPGGKPSAWNECPNTLPGKRVAFKDCPMNSNSDSDSGNSNQHQNPAGATRVNMRGRPDTRQIQTRPINQVEFAINRSGLTPLARKILDRVAQALKVSMHQHPRMTVQVEGFSDSAGTKPHNMKLSRRRAEKVRSYLAGRGVDAGRLRVIAHGESNPETNNGNRTERLANRRVLIRPVHP